MRSYNTNIFVSFNQQSIIDPQSELMFGQNIGTYLNTVPVVQTCTISAHNIGDITGLTITSNGITDGNFGIYPIKYTNAAISFVVSLVDSQGFPVKDYNLLALSSFKFSLSSNKGYVTNGVTFSSNFGTLSSLTQGGFFKGYLISTVSATNICIQAVYTDINLSLTGISNTFNIYNSAGIYNLRKINENYDQTAAYISLATQPVLYDKNVFFYGLLGQIVGNANSDPNTLGILTYEKISNYISNINDPDFCNLESLKALFDMTNVTYQNFNYQFPPSLQRLADILSVKHKNLFGQTNQYQANFNPMGFTDGLRYGVNLKDRLDINTAILSANTYPGYIVTYEKFSEKYNLVSTNVLTYNFYPLSGINNSWGWNLVLPNGVSGLEVDKYYAFYNYKPKVEGSLLQKFIDFDNPNNTLTITNSSYKDYVVDGGIMDNVLLQNLFTNLNLLTSQ